MVGMSRLTGIARAAAGFLRTPNGKKTAGGVVEQAAGLADRATKQRYTSRIEQGKRAAARGIDKL